MARNWHQHTDEWYDRRFIDWLKRPLPTLKPEHRKRVMDAFPSEEWDSYPYLMIDAICKVSGSAEEVVKWAIYYTVPDATQNDEEYRKILGLR